VSLAAALFRPVAALGAALIAFIGTLGGITRMALEAVGSMFLPPYRIRLFFKQMDFVGVGSVIIIAVTGFFTGAVFTLQSNLAFRLFGAEGFTGSTVALALTRELSPVLTALMVTGRAGSAMAAEIGTMRVTEQIDALEVMAVQPVQYLVGPRLFASVLMLPALTMTYDIVGMLGAWLVGVQYLGIPDNVFWSRVWLYVDPEDIWNGLIKGACFGFILSVVGCYRGFWAGGGAEGVGRATTRAVVISSVSVLVSDYFITSLLEYGLLAGD
jgi:phospholipid/cholesterol/gamma-HCH transport system permease protein